MASTLLQTEPFINPGSIGLPGIDLSVLDAEIALCNDPRLVFWGRARDGYSAEGLLDRNIDSEKLLIPGNVAMPAQITGLDPDPLLPTATIDPAVWAAYNDNHACKFATGATNGHLKLLNALSVHSDEYAGDFTVIIVGRSGPADNCYFWGNDQTPVATSSGSFLQWLSSGGLAFQVNGIQLIPNTATATPSFASLYADGPRMVTCALSDNLNKARMRIDRGLYDKEVTGVSAFNVEPTFRLGVAGPANAGVVDGGDFAEIMIWRGYITDDVATLAAIEALLGARYGIPAI
jgi:hypothetical protein